MYDAIQAPWSAGAIAFALLSVYTSWLIYKLIRPPTGSINIKGRDFQDAIANEFSVAILYVISYVVLALLLWQSILSLCGSQVGTDACPLHPSLAPGISMEPSLFTWNKWSILAHSIIIPAGLLRLQAFVDLGNDFTFELQKSAKLKTTGVYRYVQHPSYTGLLLVLTVVVPWHVRHDGIMAAILPVKILEFLSDYQRWVIGVLYLLTGVLFAVRMRDEEALLRNHFGKDWIKWHAQTARLIPLVF